MTEEIEKIQKKLEGKLKKSRYQHTLGVMFTAGSMAMRYEVDLNKALLAGLLHDCAKFCSNDEQITLCKKNHVELTQAELEIPSLIHAKLGARFAETKYGISDPDILNAILYHTTGRPDMTQLEKIIFLADYIEPGRKMIPGLTEIRSLAFVDLDKAVALCAKNTLEYLKTSNRKIDPMTQQTYDFYAAT